ncbi:MAG: NAD(P)/FAD-dependent oxidoreductase [Methanospirillum sp.]
MTTRPTRAILQRDGRRYAVLTRIPAGIVTADELETVARIGRTYGIPMLRITSGQRIALIGIEPEDVAKVIDELGSLAQPEPAPGIKFVQACLGTETCRYGNQDSIGLAEELERRLRGAAFPAKVKIGVSGCPRSCGESHTRDIGLMGTNRGWTVLFGGNGGRRPRIGDVVARDLATEEAIDCVQRLADYYRARANPRERTARFMERIGMETLESELLSFLPYIPLEKVN